MPFPSFNIDGVIPPFVGPNGPGGHRQALTPYMATPIEVVGALSGSPRRLEILRGWLAHRAALRGLGVISGFQWLDGSFVESKDPNDLDVVTFLHRPIAWAAAAQLHQLIVQNPAVFSRNAVKMAHHLDAIFVDMDATIEAVVDHTRYWLGLFSHRRGDYVWKGMLQVSLSDNGDDAAALALLAAAAVNQAGAAAP